MKKTNQKWYLKEFRKMEVLETNQFKLKNKKNQTLKEIQKIIRKGLKQ